MKTAAPTIFAALLCVAAGRASAQPPSGDLSEPLRLECPGEGTSVDTITDGDDRKVDIDHKFGASVQVEIANGTGRVRLPRNMLNWMNIGADGWFKMTNLKVDADRISADVRTEIIWVKTLDIDRRTGNIRIEHGNSFYGRCRAPTTNRF